MNPYDNFVVELVRVAVQVNALGWPLASKQRLAVWLADAVSLALLLFTVVLDVACYAMAVVALLPAVLIEIITSSLRSTPEDTDRTAYQGTAVLQLLLSLQILRPSAVLCQSRYALLRLRGA